MFVVVASSSAVNSLFPLEVCSSVMIQFFQNFVQSVTIPSPRISVVSEMRALVNSPFPTSCAPSFSV